KNLAARRTYTSPHTGGSKKLRVRGLELLKGEEMRPIEVSCMLSLTQRRIRLTLILMCLRFWS
ncbi:hypothetical protein LINPERHAP2_LOCUS37122, partial [Linum perenne]